MEEARPYNLHFVPTQKFRSPAFGRRTPKVSLAHPGSRIPTVSNIHNVPSLRYIVHYKIRRQYSVAIVRHDDPVVNKINPKVFDDLAPDQQPTK